MSVPRLELRIFAQNRGWTGAAVASLVAAALAGCANQTAQRYSHGREYFSQAKYGRASPKVVADGQPVPRGGGQYLVGNPYHVAGHTYYPAENASYSRVGMASWYGAAFHGRRTANGEVYDMASLTAAHPTMPLPSYARVTNLSNGYSVIVRVNDRGPFSGGRVMDVSSRVADVLDIKGAGTARIKVDYVGQAPLEGSDDSALLASLRTDGSPADLTGYSAPMMVASRAWAAQPEPPPEPMRTGGREAASRPEPELTAVRTAMRAAPAPEPIRVAAIERPPPSESPRDPPPAPVALRQPRFPVPLPPPRPFDLGAIRSTIAVASATSARPAFAVTPPRRRDLEASAEKALYFSDPGGAKPRLREVLDRLRPGKAFRGDD